MTADTACYRHPDRPSRLSCSQCGRFICPECSIDAAVGQRCPECMREMGTTRVQHMRTLSPLQAAPVTRAILVVAVGVFVLELVLPGVARWLNQWATQANPLVADGQVWRLLTSALLHAGLMHLGFNMYALYLFGPQLERRLGGPAFLSLWVASAAAGGALAFFLGGPNDRVVGASGAIFGLFGVWLYSAYRQRGTPRGRALFNQMMVLLLINAALPLIVPRISWQGHLGGLLMGIWLTWVWERLGRSQARLRATVGYAAAAAILVVVALV